MSEETEILETVKIADPKAPGGYVVINKSDLKPEDVIFGESGSAAAASDDEAGDKTNRADKRKR